MRRIAVLCVAAAILLSPVAARGQIERNEFRDWRTTTELCAYQHRVIVGFGIAHWLPEFFGVKDLILRRAAERGATERQLKKLEQRFEWGRKNAIEEGFTSSEKREPKDDEDLQSGLKFLKETLESCLVILETD